MIIFLKKARGFAVNNKNIIIGCLSMEKKYLHRNSSDDYLYDVNIDGKVYSTLDIRISGFSYCCKQFGFEKNGC